VPPMNSADEVDRVTLFAAPAQGRLWHFSAVPTAPTNVRSREENGLNADIRGFGL
jgi:hypothetical protein